MKSIKTNLKGWGWCGVTSIGRGDLLEPILVGRGLLGRK